MVAFNVGGAMKILKALHLSVASLLVACGDSASCPDGFVLAADGECYDDPGSVDSKCLTDEPLAGSVMGQTMAVNAFAYVSVEEHALALIGFQGQKDACKIVEEHVAGTVFWHDGLVLDMSIFGRVEEGATMPLVSGISQNPESLEMSIRVAETDVFQVASLAGSATVVAFSEGEELFLSPVSAEFEEGYLVGDIKACHCPDLKLFWDIEAPDIID
jgi:hypothetical protein